MKFLLVGLNAKYIHSNPALYSLRAYALAHVPGVSAMPEPASGVSVLPEPASGAPALPEAMPEAAAQIEIAEYTINWQLSDILADIYRRKPDVAAFSCYIWNWKMIRELIGLLHRVMPGLPVWLGGPEVSYDAPKLMARYPFLAGIMVGEGEVTFSQLLDYYRKKQDGSGTDKMQFQISAFWPGAAKQIGLYAIAGLYFRDPVSKEVVRTPDRAAADISSLPFYYEDLSGFENRIIYYESSRGCPFRCSYCLSSLDKNVRLRELSLVKKELQFFLDNRVPQVKFIDRTFNCNHGHAQEIWRYILENDNGVTNFHFEIEAELLDEAELALLTAMRPGLVQLEIGVQSTNPDALRAVRRYMNLSRMRHTMVRLRAAHNIHLHMDLIAGLPYEDFASFRKSFQDVYAMRPDQLQLGFLKVLKGSFMEETAVKYGIVYMEEPPYEVLSTNWLSYAELIRLKKIEEMVELYYNSCQYMHVLPVLEKAFESPFDMYEALALFYEKNGYAINSPSRAQHYRILLDFARQADWSREPLYRELLVYDMYLRENLKSRPDFAADLSPWHEKIAAFYRREEERRLLPDEEKNVPGKKSFLPGYEKYSARQMQRMTHIELFRWPMELPPWELIGLYDRMPMGSRETAVLFDYQKRDPLTGSARTVEVAL